MIVSLLVLSLASAPVLRVGTASDFLEFDFAGQGRLSWQDTLDGAAHGSIELKRLRFSLRGSLEDQQLTFGVQFNTTPAALELLDLWLGWAPTRGVMLKAGQLKTPLTRHRAGSFKALALTDWSLSSVHFGAERQVGALVELRGGQALRSLTTFGLFGGTNARASFARGVAELYGEPLLNRSDFRVMASPEAIHPEFFIQSGGAFSGMPVHLAAFFSASWDLRPTYAVDFALRLAPELKLEWRTFSLELVGSAGWARDGVGGLMPASWGGTTEVAWQAHPRWLLAARWSRVEFLAAARRDARERAARLLPDALPANRPLLETAGLTLARQEVGLGVTVGLLTALKLQLEAAWLHAEAQASTDELRVRLQVQLAL